MDSYVHHSVHKCSPPDPIMNHINPVYSLIIYLRTVLAVHLRLEHASSLFP
jgi:hypothetical protein